jgi:hypothetical protein
MMKAAMRELAQARRHYSKLPLFEFLRNDSIAPRERLAFYPCKAPFILAFSGQRMFHIELDIDRRIGLWDTAAMPRIFEIGQRAASTHLPAIRRLLESPRKPLDAPSVAVRNR